MQERDQWESEAVDPAMMVIGSGPSGTAAVNDLGQREGFHRSPALDTGGVVAISDPAAPAGTETETVPDALLEEAALVVIVADLDEVDDLSSIPQPACGNDQVTVLVTPPSSNRTSDWEPEDNSGDIDTLLLSPPSQTGQSSSTDDQRSDPLSRTLADLVALVTDPGFVNVDLSDAKTVFQRGDLAVLGSGTTSLQVTKPAEQAVVDAWESIPAAIGVERAAGALLELRGDRSMTVIDTNGAVSAVRNRIGDGAHIIWGAAIDDSSQGLLSARLLISDVECQSRSSVPSRTRDSCPRCDGDLGTYSMGEKTTVSCESCGYVDVSMSLD